MNEYSILFEILQMEEKKTLREAILEQNKKDEEFCLNITRNVISAIQSTRVIKDIKISLQKQFYKYFAHAKKLFFREHQIKIINQMQSENLIEYDIDNILNEDFFYVNVPLNYSERKAQKLSDLCRRITLAASSLKSEELINFKMILFEFFSTIKIDIDLEKEEEEDIIENIMKEGQLSQSNFVIFSTNQ